MERIEKNRIYLVNNGEYIYLYVLQLASESLIYDVIPF